jgi:hypothetical protein
MYATVINLTYMTSYKVLIKTFLLRDGGIVVAIVVVVNAFK